MNRWVIALLGFLGITAVSLASVALWVVGVRDRTIGLENQFVAAKESREALYDNMFKQIQEKFKLTNLERSTAVKLIDGLVAGRSGGNMFKMVQEQYPQLDQSMFKEVSATISGKRDEFTRSQQNLMQIKKEHTDLRTQTITSFIIGSRPALEFTVVSSSDAKEVMATGTDDHSALDDK